MKKTISFLGVTILVSLMTSSCSEEKKEIEVKAQSTEVGGDLSSYYVVADENSKLMINSESGSGDELEYNLKVKIARNASELDFDASDLESRGYFLLVCDLLDEQGVPVITGDRDGFRTQGVNSEDAAIAALKVDESGWAIFSFYGTSEEMEKVKFFQVSGVVDMEQADASYESGDSEGEDEESDSETGGGDCEQFVSDYEAFADSYIALLKKYKANPNDPDILTEYTDAAQKALDMQKDAALCTDPAYASRIAAIAAKIASAAM